MKDIQKEIEMNKKLKMLNLESNSREINQTMQHEYDLFAVNQERYKSKINDIMQRNDVLYSSNQQNYKKSQSIVPSDFGHKRNLTNFSESGMNSLIISSNGKELSQEDRLKKSKEILDLYKKQLISKTEKSKKRYNHSKLVERVLVDKQCELSQNQINEEKMREIKKRIQQKQALDEQIQENKKCLPKDNMTAVFV